MDALDEFKKVLGFQELLIDICGINIFKEDYKYSYRAFIVLFFCAIYTVSLCYDIYVFWDDTFHILFCVTTTSSVIIGGSRILVLLLYYKQYRAIRQNSFDAYLQTGDTQWREEEILNKTTKIFVKCTKMYNILYVGLFLMSVMPTLIVYLVKNEMILPYGVTLPILDFKQTPGFQINYAVHCIYAIYGCIGTCGPQNVFLAMIFSIYTQSKILEDKFKSLGQMIECQETDGSDNSGKIKDKLIDVIRYHQKYIEFANSVEKHLNIEYLVEMVSYTLQITICMYVVYDEVSFFLFHNS